MRGLDDWDEFWPVWMILAIFLGLLLGGIAKVILG
jgi:ACR3 family arsenite efflux pump ArsB